MATACICSYAEALVSDGNECLVAIGMAIPLGLEGRYVRLNLDAKPLGLDCIALPYGFGYAALHMALDAHGIDCAGTPCGICLHIAA